MGRHPVAVVMLHITYARTMKVGLHIMYIVFVSDFRNIMPNLGETSQYIYLKSSCLFVICYLRTDRPDDFSRLSSGAQTRLTTCL
jgi:hypothetical protein